ncbi:GntR family transcriptional regulator [Mycobacterium tuberculosis]|nr:GntR family transcriptional regulator [Mycobacterium tuberculosis]
MRPDQQRTSGASVGDSNSRRLKVADQIIEEMRTAILVGEMKPGSKLPNERDLAAKFGVSQPTVREAVRALVTMGLLDVRHGSGVYVTFDTRASIASALNVLVQLEHVRVFDVLEIRAALAIYSIRRAVEHASDEEIENIEKLATAMVEADTVQGVAEATVEFQVGLAAAAHHPLLFAIECFLFELLMKFQYKAHRHRGAAFWMESAEAIKPYRDRVLAALRARDSDTAVEEMSAYQERLSERWLSEPALAKIELAGPSAMQTLSQITVHIPDVRAVKY